MRNGSTVNAIVVASIVVFGSVILALFTFSYARSSEAYSTSIQNRERISVIESQYKEITKKLDALGEDLKTLLQQERK